MIPSDMLAIMIATNAGYVAIRLLCRKDAWAWCCVYWCLVTLRWILTVVGR